MKIYNSLTRQKDEFVPLKKGQVKMYVCGPTVYDEPHIGHARSAYVFDIIRRYLEYKKYKVTFVRNVTDVDDKIIDKAKKEYKAEPIDAAVNKVTKKYLDAYHEALNKLGIKPVEPRLEPKATAYIKKMQQFIKILIDREAAYPSGGDVYFDIKKARGYGKLSNQSLDMMEAGARVSAGENKRDPLDFALWKASKEGEPSWPSPWGNGRPGWHIECSAMSSDILGDEFDIHGGGVDLIFPHHENEIAQSEGAGKKFARYWIHHGLLTISAQKMAKSLGNFVTVGQFIEKYKDPDYLKLLFLNTHYRHPVDYTDEKIEEMKKEKEKFIILFHRLDQRFGTRDFRKLPTGSRGNIDTFKKTFEDAMDDDFNMPVALGVLLKMVSECNKILDNEKNDDRILMISYAVESIINLGNIFGISLENIKKEKSDTWVTVAMKMREQFRKEKKYKEADEVRKDLESKGIILEDTKDGTTWRRKV